MIPGDVAAIALLLVTAVSLGTGVMLDRFVFRDWIDQ